MGREVPLRYWLSVAVFLALPSVADAQKGRGQVNEGNRLYTEGRYSEAHEKYLEALRDAPESGVVRFNDGNALYKTEEYQRAEDAYRAAVESGDPALRSRAWYNIGNALYRGQQLDAALEAFKQALRLDPGDVDAKHNLERVLEQQKNNDQQQNQQQDQQQRQDDNQRQEQQQDQRQQQEQRQGQAQEQQQRQQQGQMSREEAERLLQAIDEDPSKIDRQRKVTAANRRPKKDW